MEIQSRDIIHYNFKKELVDAFWIKVRKKMKYRICACISRTFGQEITSKIGVRPMHGILCPFDDYARDTGIVL
jgi:hypothetical protein